MACGSSVAIPTAVGRGIDEFSRKNVTIARFCPTLACTKSDAVVAQLASRCHMSTEHLRGEHTRGSGADVHRGAVTACLEERRSHARSWRKPSIQVSIPPVASIPQPSEHICCEISAVRRSFDTGQSQ